MLPLSLVLLLLVGLLGGVLAALQPATGESARSRRLLGALHGGLGFVGLAVLLLALRGPPRGAAMGVASFGHIAAALLAVALFVGLAILVMHQRNRRVSSLVIGLHATVAIGGVAMLAAYVFVG